MTDIAFCTYAILLSVIRLGTNRIKMKFIGREEYLVEKQISTDELSFSLIYGRRRVGKSELIKQILRNTDIKSIYFECKQVSEESNVTGLANIVSEVLDLPKLGYTDIESILDYIFKLAEKENLFLYWMNINT